MSKLKGKVALVTGGSKGIGAEIAIRLAAEGVLVFVHYGSSKPDAERVVERITSNGGRAMAQRADLSVEGDVVRLFAETKQHTDRLDILVNNAGIYEFSPLENLSADHFHKLFDLNVLGLLVASREAVKLFGTTLRSIVNVSSVVSTHGIPTGSVYSATKAAVDAITRSLAKELGARGIRVNSVNPGMVETEGTRTAGITDSHMRRETEARTPLGRIGRPSDIAPAVVFLASPEADWITGETLYISGGMR